MVRGGKKILNYLLILTFLMISSLSFAQTNEPLYIQYTAPIGMQTLNPNIKSNKNYYNSTSYGASHSILNEIFKNTNVKTKYTPYSNYNEALQTSMLYLSNNTPDIIIGITFDENNLEYLDYISQPIYTDNIVLVIDKSYIPNNNAISKDLFETISQLSQTNNALYSDLKTVFLITKPEFNFISSSMVREILANKGDISKFVPKAVEEFLTSKGGIY